MDVYSVPFSATQLADGDEWAKKLEKPTLNRKTRRGYGLKKSKHKSKHETKNFTIIGANTNGLNLKRESFYSLVNTFQPTVITLQETKFVHYRTVKLNGYEVFEALRTNKDGGGLLTAARLDTNPVLVEEDGDSQILIIQIEVSGKLRKLFFGKN